VKASVLEAEAKARPVLDRAACETRKASLDCLDRVGRREQCVHVGLAKIERHSLDTLGMADWLTVPVEELEPDGRTLVEHDGHEIAVFRVDGSVYAVANSCPHEGNPLIEGEILGANLTCAYHAWTFDLATGSCLVGDEAARSYPVEVRDGLIRIGIEDF
jgi:nitrite reductase/ring-hydroxylating ferredoxin subunit